MHRRLTIGEARWPETREFSKVTSRWRSNSSAIMLGCVWQGYDLLSADVLSQIDISLADEQLERSITQFLTPRVRDCMTGYEPFHIEQGVYEVETRVSSSAQPPLYDLAFVLKANPRIMWPLEAKVLRTDGAVGHYLDETAENFLTCRYAPFSGEGAMLGYLLTGLPDNVFAAIERKMPCTLDDHADFPSRNHKISDHERIVSPGKPYPADFRCHHLIMLLAQTSPCP